MTSKARNIADLGSNDVIETTATGVDVTGTVTADGLTVDGSITANLGSAHKVQLSGNYPYVDMVETDTADVNTRLQNSSGNFLLRTVNDADTSAYTRLKVDHATGDVSFYEDTGTTAKMVWDASAESLGIGTSSPTNKLSISTSTYANSYVPIQDLKYSTYDVLKFGYTASGGGIRTGTIDTSNYGFAVNTGNGTERMRIDSSGNVGIGTDSPSYLLHIDGADSGGGIAIQDGNDFGTTGLHFLNDSGAVVAEVRGRSDNTGMTFHTAGTERARMNDYGELLLGISTTPSADKVKLSTDSIHCIGDVSRSTLASSAYARLVMQERAGDWISLCDGSGTHYGTISESGNGVSYGSNSDYRLKENVSSLVNASDRVLQLNPCRFNFINNPEQTIDGFLAHEAQEVVPEAVTGVKDGYQLLGNVLDSDGNIISENIPEPDSLEDGQTFVETSNQPKYQQLDQAKLVPLLTKALQEALDKIEQLEQRVDAMENN